VPDDVIVAMMADAIREAPKAGFVLDGFPRTVNQAVELDNSLASNGGQIDVVLNLKIDDSMILQRMTGRPDDSPEVVANRLRTYHLQTEPVVDYYRENNTIHEIDAGKNVDEASALVFEKLDALVNA
jgi:adenylate kinase